MDNCPIQPATGMGCVPEIWRDLTELVGAGHPLGIGQLLPVVAALSAPILMARRGIGFTLTSTSLGVAATLFLLAFVPAVWMVALAYMGVMSTVTMMSTARRLGPGTCIRQVAHYDRGYSDDWVGAGLVDGRARRRLPDRCPGLWHALLRRRTVSPAGSRLARRLSAYTPHASACPSSGARPGLKRKRHIASIPALAATTATNAPNTCSIWRTAPIDTKSNVRQTLLRR